MTKKEFIKRVCKDIVDGKHENIEDKLLTLADLGCGSVAVCDTVTLFDVIAYFTDCGFKFSSDAHCYDRNMCILSTYKSDANGEDRIHFGLNFEWEEEVKA